jgi:predicted phage terminase large subunit-like protein
MRNGKRAGGCYAVPLGGTITGFRAGHMAPGFQGAIIIDDPLKPEDAFSEARLKAANRRLSDTVRSRKANPETPVILIMQRIHVDDPTAYALSGQIGGLEFELIKIPALNDDGTSYWPYKEPAEELIAWRDANPYTFAGQMQQEPMVLGGTIFRGEWFRYWATLPEITTVKVFADTAMKTAERNDFSVFQVWGLGADGWIYLLDQVRGKWAAPQLRDEAEAIWKKWQGRPMGEEVPYPSAFVVEDKASGTGLIQSLQQETAIPVVPIQREIDKLVRAMSTAPTIQAGRVFLPDPDFQPRDWLPEYLAEFLQFNAEGTHKFDDQIDPTMDAVHDLILGDGNFYSWL